MKTIDKNINRIMEVMGAHHLPDDILMEAYHILFGRKEQKSMIDKAAEMRLIIRGDIRPRCDFSNWVSAIRFLAQHCD